MNLTQNFWTFHTANIIQKGFIGFDQYDFNRIPTKKEVNDLKNISDIISIFIIEMRTAEKNTAMKDIAFSIVNALNSYAYVIDPETYKILFLNDNTKSIASNAQVGEPCYQAFWKRETPCENCPMNGLSKEKTSRCSLKIHNPNFDIWIKATASWIRWIDGKIACLMDNVNI